MEDFNIPTLPDKLTLWGELRKQLDFVEQLIEEEVIALGKTQEYGDVEAKFRKSSTNGKYNWERVVSEIEPDIEVIEKHTKVVTTVDYKAIAEECDAPDELVKKYYTPPVEGVPTVTVQFKKVK